MSTYDSRPLEVEATGDGSTEPNHLPANDALVADVAPFANGQTHAF